jgi:hypothetical protein
VSSLNAQRAARNSTAEALCYARRFDAPPFDAPPFQSRGCAPPHPK